MIESREPVPPPSDTVVDVVGARAAARDGQRTAKPTGEESGLVLDLGDAIEVVSGSPPPRPLAPAYPNAGPTEVMKHPPDMSEPRAKPAAPPPARPPAADEEIESVLPWYRQRAGTDAQRYRIRHVQVSAEGHNGADDNAGQLRDILRHGRLALTLS